MTVFRTLTRTAGVIVGLAALSAAHAATTVENLGGTVRVNQGKGYSVLQGAGNVKPGDTIMVDLRGKGRVVYSDGCTVNVKPGSIVTVAEVSPCSLTAQSNDDRDRRDASVFPPIDPATGLLAVAGLAAAGAGAAAIAGSSGGGGGNNIIPFIRPASP